MANGLEGGLRHAHGDEPPRGDAGEQALARLTRANEADDEVARPELERGQDPEVDRRPAVTAGLYLRFFREPVEWHADPVDERAADAPAARRNDVEAHDERLAARVDPRGRRSNLVDDQALRRADGRDRDTPRGRRWRRSGLYDGRTRGHGA